ncbi:hypothetical protein SH449x_000597 [Pirellulaceae bacterium SH449]
MQRAAASQLDCEKRYKKHLLIGVSFNATIIHLPLGERPPSDLDEGFGPWLGGQGAWSASTYTNGTRGLFPTSGAVRVNLLAECDGRTNLGFQSGERGTRCPTHHWSFHSGGAVFAKADGSVIFLCSRCNPRRLDCAS